MRGTASALAFGQIVCTADALGEVEGVRFEVGGEPRTVPKGDGENTDGPLTCDDYADVMQPPAA